uniref:Small ribosomal subunit protein uS8 n=1 Tax=Salvator merianae TaxID=96440 RepID=A0A8D0DGD0_SALMN
MITELGRLLLISQGDSTRQPSHVLATDFSAARMLAGQTEDLTAPLLWNCRITSTGWGPILGACGVISPRFDVQLKDLEKWQNNLLPSRQFGYIVLTTSAGIMDHEEARRKHTGGK